MKERRRLEPIAIVGLGAVMPGAKDAPSFWSNIESGKDGIGEVPADRWDWRVYFDPNPKAKDKTYSKIGGFIRDFTFDPLPFRIPPPVASQMDGIQKLAVTATAQALADAGYDKKPFDTERTAVILGNSMGGPKRDATDLRIHSQELRAALSKSKGLALVEKGIRDEILRDLSQFVDSELPAVNEDSMPGELSNVMAGRVANVFNLNGPNFTVDAACASSLAALDAAVKGLRLRDFDMAVCGAVDQMMGPAPYVKFSKIGALSPDGSRPFDDRANGFVMGEGAGVYLLKRLSDAVKDGDKIYAVIRSIGASSDGKGKGITAPNPKGQKLAIERAFAALEYGPDAVGLIEAHGTSTPVGDSTEVAVLGQVFAGRPNGSVGLGSVKSQIGHLKAAAGAASIIKTAFALQKKVLPPSIHFEKPNRAIDWARSPFRVLTQAEPWTSDRPRRANVSAFGFGGTNFHVALEEYRDGMLTVDPRLVPMDEARPAEPLPASVEAEAFIVTADSVETLKNRLMNLAPEDPLLASAQPLRAEPRKAYRASFAARNAAEAVEKAAAVAKALAHETVWTKPPALFRAKGLHVANKPSRPKVAFLFPGQGSQYVDMMRDLSLKYRVVADTFAEADRIMAPLLGRPLTSLVWSEPGETPEQKAKREERIKATEITQPAVLTGDVAMLRLLGSFGVTPDMTAGHSLGEYGALVAAGILRFEDALLAVSARAKEMAGVKVPDPGKMASIAASWERVQKELAGIEGYVAGANRNCPIQTVIAGETKAVEAAIAKFNALGIQAVEIRVSHAFHSKIVEPAQPAYSRFLATVPITAPKLPILSNVTAGYYPTAPAAIRELLVRQIASPVEWTGQIERMYADGVRVFVEVGPKRVLTAFVSSILESKPDAVALASNHPKRGGLHEFNETLAGLEGAGVELDWDGKEPGGAAYTEEFKKHVPSSGASRHLLPASAGRRSDEQPSDYEKFGFNTEPIVVSGLAAGVPGTWDAMFREGGLDELLRGQNLIEKLSPEAQKRQLDKNITRVHKSETGHHEIRTLATVQEVVKLAARKGEFDLAAEFGVPENVAKAMDVTFQLSMAAGLLALKDAQLPLVRRYKRTSTGGALPQGWSLPEPLRDSTGIIFASAFPCMDTIVEELTRYYEAKAGRGSYSFSRDLLLKAMAMGHGQLAQLIGARGPAMHMSAACASTTQAVGVAEDWIRLGRAKRVIVVAADDITNERLQEWFITGFLAAGAATTESAVSRAALPFDRRRHGMIVGSGAVGLVIEEKREADARGAKPRAEVLATQFENSAYHPTRLDPPHVAQIMDRLLSKAERRTGLRRADIAGRTLFMSHETYTPARGGSASAEVEALKKCFGPDAGKVLVANTKGFTGHTMGASLEDAVAIRAMNAGKAPPIANYKEADPELAGIRLSDGGSHDLEYALRLGAGFGSQTAMTLMRRLCRDGEPRLDAAKHKQWLASVTGIAMPELEVVQNTLRVKDTRAAVPTPAAPAPTPAAVPDVRAELVEAPIKASLDVSAVEKAIVELVSQKTGYPKEMLELDLDMEADLGIDTVKQAELFGMVREKYALPRQEGLSLKHYPTLRHVIRYVVEGTGAPKSEAAPAPMSPTVAPVVAAAPAPAAATVAVSDERVQQEVLELVSQKTGYPKEMLELDLDMEADLGIDTVKQAELFGMVREKYALPRQEGLSLKQYPTLRHVIRFVLDAGKGSPAAQPSAPAAALAGPSTATIRRRTLVWNEIPLPPQRRQLAPGAMLLVGAPRALKAFQSRFDEAKIPTAWLQTKPFIGSAGVDLTDAKAMDAALAKLRSKGPISGLVYLPGLDLGSDDAPEAFEGQYRGAVRPLFLLAKALREDLSRPGCVSLVATAMGGKHAPETESPMGGALTGLAKALSRELGVRFAAVDFGREPLEALARQAVDELLSAAEDAEVGYARGKRWTPALAEAPLGAASPRLFKGSVLLVTGGARGLGAEFARQAAARWGCRLAIFGRTALREESRAWAALDEAGLAALKASMWERLRGEQGRKATPVVLEREFAKVSAAVELRRSLDALGPAAAYFECDLSRRESVQAAAAKALETFGRVDAVVHAAGLEESKKLEDKTSESFDAVFRAKAHGLRYLLDALPADPKRSYLFFSSVVARFGNTAQLDYAAANDCLVKTAARLAARGSRAVAADLGAFADVGMATRGGVKPFLESMGVEFMKPADGMARLVDELDAAEGPHEIVLAAGLGKLEASGKKAIPVAAPAPVGAPAAPLRTNGFKHLLEGMAPKDKGLWVGFKKFSLESDPYLSDHAIGGTPYVPGVMGLELFAQALWEIDSPKAKETVRGFTDVRFALPIKLLRNKPLAVRALAKPAGDAVALELESDFVTPQGVKLGGPRTHFSAKAGPLPSSRFDGAKPAFGGAFEVSREAIYKAYFHGERFQVLEGIVSVSPERLVSKLRTSKPLWSEPHSLLISPLLLEAAFQTCGYRDLHYDKRMTLPDSIGAVLVHASLSAGDMASAVSPSAPALFVQARFKGRDAQGRSVYDAFVTDAEGRLAAELQDYRMIGV